MSVELAKDLSELESFRRSSCRPDVQRRLDSWINECKVQLEKLKQSESAPNTEVSAKPQASSNRILRPVKKLTTYALDESDKFIKLYYTLPGVQSIPADQVGSTITEDSFEVKCIDVNGVDYEVSAKGLLHSIDPTKSLVKQKSDLLLVMLKKSKESETWGALLKLDMNKTQMKVPDFDEKADPQESMMKMMKQMYDDGDDEMKRTIRKTWYESQSKKMGGSLGDLDM